MYGSVSLTFAQNEIAQDTLGVHPWKETNPMAGVHDLAHWSVAFEAGMDINNVDFSATGLSVLSSTRVRPSGGVSFGYDFTPVFGVAAAYTYGNYGAKYNGTDGMDFIMYSHMHNLQIFFTMDIMDAFVKMRHSTIFSAYFLLGGGAGFYNGEYLMDGIIMKPRDDGKYSPTGIISLGALLEFNLSRTTALGLKGMYSIYTADIMDARQNKGIDFMEYISLGFRWKINAMERNHVRNYTSTAWRQRNEGAEESSRKDTVVFKDTTVIVKIDTVYAICAPNPEDQVEQDSVGKTNGNGLGNTTENTNENGLENSAETLAENIVAKDSVQAPIDTDGDGVPDDLDHCPDTPAEVGGMVDRFGCPLDSDRDGVPDYLDECPDTPDEGRYAVDSKGCLRDRDGDGVPDYLDQCPAVPGVMSNNGCPEVKKEVRSLLKKAMQGIQFETGKSTIKATSYPLLNQIANAFLDEPTWRVEVQGHTDNVGNAETNQRLSEARANAVRDYLIKAGVPASQLIAHGYGMTMPIADNSTAEGRATNRRVEFVVTFEKVTFETVSGTTVPSSN